IGAVWLLTTRSRQLSLSSSRSSSSSGASIGTVTFVFTRPCWTSASITHNARSVHSKSLSDARGVAATAGFFALGLVAFAGAAFACFGAGFDGFASAPFFAWLAAGLVALPAPVVLLFAAGFAFDVTFDRAFAFAFAIAQASVPERVEARASGRSPRRPGR